MRKFLLAIVCSFFVLTSSMSIAAEKKSSADSKIAAMQKEIEQLKKDVLELKTLFVKAFLSQQGLAPGQRAEAPGNLPQQAPQLPPVVEFKLNKDLATMGNRQAPLTLIEFSDYECPFCERFHNDAFAKIKQEYIDTGKVRFVYVDMPLSFHANAKKASEAVHCAGEQNKYWQMHDMVFKNQRNLSDINSLAPQAGLDAEKFSECMSSGRHSAMIQDSNNSAVRLGINGTPSFVLGKASADGTVKGMLIVGAQPFGAFKEKIESELQR